MFAYALPEPTLWTFLISGFLGVAPDLDFLGKLKGEEFHKKFHRTIMHTIFPAAFLVGIATQIIFGSFLLGFMPYAFHTLADAFNKDGVEIWPGKRITLPIVTEDGIDLMVSSITGMALLLLMIGIELLRFLIIQ